MYISTSFSRNKSLFIILKYKLIKHWVMIFHGHRISFVAVGR